MNGFPTPPLTTNPLPFGAGALAQQQNSLIGKAQSIPASTGIQAAIHRLNTMESVKSLLPKVVKHLTLDETAEYAMQALDTIGNFYHAQFAMLVQPETDGQFDMPDGCEDIDYIVKADYLGLRIGITATSFDEMLLMASQPSARFANAPGTATSAPVEQTALELGQRWIGMPGVWQSLQARWGSPLPVSIVTGERNLRLRAEAGTGLIVIVYKARITDHRGWPMLTPLEARACANYCAFVEVHDKYMQKQFTKQQRDDTYEMYDAALGPARNQGLGDKEGLQSLLNNATSFHRHLYGSPVPLNNW